MTTPDVITEASAAAEVIGRLDEDWAVPCERAARRTTEGDDCGGQNAAEWILWPICGCAPLMYCGLCRVIVTSYRRLICGHCGARWRWRPWQQTAFRLIEPLNRRTT